MIQLLIPKAEYYSNCVINWLINIKEDYLKIDSNTDFPINKEDSFWYRKGRFEMEIAKSNFLKYFETEARKFLDFKIYQLEKLPHIGNYFERIPNKMQHLELVKSGGLPLQAFLIFVTEPLVRERSRIQA